MGGPQLGVKSWGITSSKLFAPLENQVNVLILFAFSRLGLDPWPLGGVPKNKYLWGPPLGVKSWVMTGVQGSSASDNLRSVGCTDLCFLTNLLVGQADFESPWETKDASTIFRMGPKSRGLN